MRKQPQTGTRKPGAARGNRNPSSAQPWKLSGGVYYTSCTHSTGQAHWGTIAALPFPLCPTTYSFDIPPLSGRAGQAEAYHVHKQARDAQQVHGIPDEGRGDDVIDEEGSVVRQEHTPGEVQREQAAGGAPSLQDSKGPGTFGL